MKENTVKTGIMVLDICCLTLCTVLNIQIAIQKEQLQIGGYVEEQMQLLEKEKRANLVKLEDKNSQLTENACKMIKSEGDFLDKYDDVRCQTEEGERQYEVLKSEYDKRLYLDTVILDMDEEKGSHEYVERYFKIDKKSLQEVLEQTQWEKELGAQFLETEKWGELLPVGERIWNLYEKDSSPDSYPQGVLIENPLIDFGYKDARAGMNLLTIKDKYPAFYKEDKSLSDGNFRYLQYEDERYKYYYVTVDHCVDCTVLYVTHR